MNSLKTIHPVFNVFCCQVSVHENVKRVSGINTTDERELIVGTPGIFLLKSRNFPKSRTVQLIIPYADLTEMIVESDCLTLITDKSRLVLRTPHSLNIAARINVTRLTLFPSECFPFRLTTDTKIRQYLDRNLFIYQTSSVLADRFLSCVLRSQQSLVSTQLDLVCNHLSQITTSLDVSQTLLNLPYLQYIIEALSMHRSLTQIKIFRIPVSKALPVILPILQANPGICRLIFLEASFSCPGKQFKEFSEFVDHGHLKVTEFVFEDSPIDIQDFQTFFECFIKYEVPIKMLTFNRCKFNQFTFEVVCQTIFFAQCFHSLETLWLSDVRFPDNLSLFLQQLFASDWIIKSRCLQTLAIIDCCFQLDALFNQILQFHPGIVTLNFSGNPFINPPPEEMAKLFGPNVNLVFSKCGYSDDSLVSLFKSLSKHKGQTLQLDVSGIIISSVGWDMFYEMSPSIVLPTLTTFIWDNNTLNAQNVDSFVAFLKNQPNLAELSISNCIEAEESGPVIQAFLNYFKGCQLSSLTIKATTNKTILGPRIMPLIQTILSLSRLRYLDITGQCIGDNGILKIVHSIPFIMDSFIFEGNMLTSAEIILEVVNTLMKSNITFATWPENDIEPALLKAPIAMRGEIAMKLNMAKSQFIAKFGLDAPNEEDLSTIATIARYNTIAANDQKHHLKEGKSKVRVIPSNHAIDAFVDQSEELFCLKDDSLSELLKEINVNYDPISALHESVKAKCTIQALMKSLSNLE